MNTATVWDKNGKSTTYPVRNWEIKPNGELVVSSPGEAFGFAPGEWTRFTFEVKGAR